VAVPLLADVEEAGLKSFTGGLAILGLGTALPAHAMSQDEAFELARRITCRTAEQESLVKVLYRRAGVSQRQTVVPHRLALEWLPPEDPPQTEARGPTTAERMMVYGREAPLLAEKAAAAALADAGSMPEEIAHLVTVSCTGFHAPGVDIQLIERLGLRPTVQRTHIGFMGCHGAINGLRVAQALAGSTRRGKLLLCAVELCSLHFQYAWDPELLVGNAVFGDGAAALVGQASDDPSAWRVAATGSCLLPDSSDAMSWAISDHGFVMQLSARVPDLIKLHLRPWLESWLGEQGVRLSEIGAWDVHPGGPRILSAVEAALELKPQATATSRDVLREHGNLSSPTVLFVLQRLREQAARRPCVMLAFGPGLVAEAALVF
jgi:predicted naringenin-chalcone synthase